MKTRKPNVGIVTVPIGDNGNIPLSNMLDILYPLSNSICVLTGGSGYVLTSKHKKVIQAYNIGDKKKSRNIFFELLKAVVFRLKISYIILKKSKNIDMYIFFIGCDSLLPATLTAKLCHKPVLLALPGSAIDCLRFGKNPFSKLSLFMIKLNRLLSDGIVIYSKRCINEHDFKKYKNKIYIAREHQLDLCKFNVKTEYNKRSNVVGYIGNINDGKGVLNFVQAIPKLLMERDDLDFLIGGSGPAMSKIKQYLDEHNLNSKVRLVGWISHDKVPYYLNELKLFVLPSYTEGLPNVMLEAMACGTPVLVTPVGAIPDFIQDGINGFILENNTPKNITKSIKRALESPEIEEIANRAHELIENEFTYDKTVEMYKVVLESTFKPNEL